MQASDVLYDFLVGAALGGIGGGVEAAANRFARFDNSLGENGRKAMRGSYQEGKDTAQHVKDFLPAYNAGVEGKANPNPTNETAYAGYVAGQNDAKAEARKKTFAQENERGSGLVYDEYVAREMNSTTADEINTVAKALGVRVRMADEVRGGTANGVIEGNEIRIAKDAQDPVMQVVGHEWTHRVQDLAPEQYTAFRSAIMENDDVAEAAKILHEQYNRMGVEISMEQAMDEAAANYAGEMIANTDVLNEFIRRHSEDRTLLEKLRDAIREIVGKLTGKAKQQAQTAEGLLQQAFEAAAQNSKNAATEGGTRFDLKGKNKDGIEVYETSGGTMALTWDDRRAKYLDDLKNEYRGKTARFERNGHTYYAKFDQNSIRKPIYGDSRASGNGVKALTKAGADGDVFNLLENSKYTGSKPNTKTHTSADYFDYFIKTVQIDGKVFDLVADVEKEIGTSGGYIYTLALRDNKNIKASPALGTPEMGPVKSAGNASENSVLQNEGNVKRYSLKPEEDYIANLDDTSIENRKKDISVDEAIDALYAQKGLSYRFYNGEDPMSRAGYAMFSDDPDANGSAYGGDHPKAFSVDERTLTDISDITQKIIDARHISDEKTPWILEDYEGVSDEEFAALFDPADIVDSAAAYDDEALTSWLWDNVLPGALSC